MRKGKTDGCDEREKERGYKVKLREGEKGSRKERTRKRGGGNRKKKEN